MDTQNTLTLMWGDDAAADFKKILDFLEENSPAAMERLIAAVENKTEELRSFPKMHRIGRMDGTREMLVKPSYVIVYTETDEVIRINRMLHTSQQWP
ncbi:type II toxin-antitoxin system RelE/ParE family toxin [Rhizobium sp. CF142]|uniref:type II toxin-antitoxin system RelE/ParE family toxin n=1 Tax=Rhizobium sp. CF142 TaxID=1144314 RepID=UPI00026EEDDD|nr:type II toxin-antitoxin system mRNA interferase toxin, RelE/StbE family [Rhizobium sp. CF142]EJJ27215.1 addiction module toxin, RelE/StbE family [Rhizobium sp. CF142]